MTESHAPNLLGIHHVTAICGDPQRNIDFYSGFLGLRLVKKTVNFDDPGSYHLYYGDALGTPGTILTFFAWIGSPPLSIVRGRPGTGQVVAASFAVPRAALDFWVDRLADSAADFDAPERRFDELVLTFRDPDGIVLELVGRDDIAARAPWREGPVAEQHAIRGLAGASLCLEGYERTAALLGDTLGFHFVGAEANRFRFETGVHGATARIDLVSQPDALPGRTGTGTVHHIAWRTLDDEEHERWRARLGGRGLDVTPIIDRQYFHSIYFREPGGVLFEIATDPPGFTIDEAPEVLGQELQLPYWLESRRSRIEARLPEVRAPGQRVRSTVSTSAPSHLSPPE
jgi:glyoxalase family protein